MVFGVASKYIGIILRGGDFSLLGTHFNVLGLEKVGVGFTRATAEGAEFTSNETDVREINVAVDDVGDDVSGQFATQYIGSDQQAEAEDRAAMRVEQ